MKSSIKTIKYLAALSVVLLLVTYSISLNDENRWIVLNTPWLSKNFAFTIAGGSFASMLVVLACELQKYQSIKCQTEDFIFGQLFSLYLQVTIIHYNTKRQLNDKSSSVPSNLISENANKGKMCLANLNSIEYVTLYNNDAIKMQLIQYRGEVGTHILFFLQNTLCLKMAINEDKIALLKNGKDKAITSNAQLTHHTLNKIYCDSEAVLSYLEGSLGTINKECNNRYHWSDLKRSVISGEETLVSADLESYLKQPVIHFKKKEI